MPHSPEALKPIIICTFPAVHHISALPSAGVKHDRTAASILKTQFAHAP